MKLALMLIKKSNEPVILHDEKGKGPRMLMLGWQEQLALLLVILIASMWIWFGLLEPFFRKVPVPAIRVPHPMQVVTYEPGTLLQLGDTVFITAKSAPFAGKIAALPLQSVKTRNGNGPEQFVILGVDQYYIIGADGVGKVFNRALIRGIVQTQA